MKRILVVAIGCASLATTALALPAPFAPVRQNQARPDRVTLAWAEPAPVSPAAEKKQSLLPADIAPPEKNRANKPRHPLKPGAIQFQEFDDPIEPLVPLKSRTAAEQARVEARAWFATGRILQQSQDPQGALAAYKKAIEHDPRAVVVYKTLVPLAFSLNLNDDAIKWAMKAVELDPQDVDLLRRLGLHQATHGDLASGIRLLEQAARSPNMKKDSLAYLELMRDLAIIYRTARQPKEAARCFEVLFDAMQHPDKFQLDLEMRSQLLSKASAVYEQIGQAFLEAGRAESAIAAFRKAAENRKGEAGGLHVSIAQVYLQNKQPAEALSELQKYFDEQRQTKGRTAYELLGEILKQQNKSTEFLPRLQALAEKDPRNAILQYFLADQYAAALRYTEAESLYKRTLTANADAAGYLGLARIYRVQQKPEELLRMLAKGYDESGKLEGLQTEFKALLADQKLVEQLLQTARKLRQATPPKLDYPAAYVAANLAADAKVQEDFATEFYRFALSLKRDRAETILEELGQYYISVKKYTAAAETFEELVNEPGLAAIKANSLFLLTQARELAGDTKGALEAIKSAREMMPEHPLLQYQEAWVYYHSQQYPEAIKRFEAVIAAYPQAQFKSVVRRAQFSLSNIHVLLGQIRQGELILEQVLKETPDDPSVNNDLGYLYADQGKNLEQADRMIRKAIAAEPDNGAYLDSLGWVLFKQGKAQEAAPYLEKAVKNATSGGDETMWDHLGDVYDRLQRRTDALAAWKKGLASAKLASRPDAKLIQRIEEKIRTAEAAGKPAKKTAQP